MPNTDDVTPDPIEETPAVAAPAAPSFVPADEFKQFQTTITETLGALREGIAAIRAGGGQPPSASTAAPIRITDDEFDEAVASGNGKVARAYLAQQKDDLKREHIDPLSTTGLDSLSGLTKEVVLKGMPRYAKYKGEIDALIAQMPPQARLNPEALRMAHDAVIGKHADEIEAEAREQATRARTAEPAETVPSSRRGTRIPVGDKTPSVEDVAGAEGAQALAELGRVGKSSDDFARSLGYKDWKSYMKETEAYV